MHPKKNIEEIIYDFIKMACHSAQILMDQVRYTIHQKQNETLTTTRVHKMNKNTDKTEECIAGAPPKKL